MSQMQLQLRCGSLPRTVPKVETWDNFMHCREGQENSWEEGPQSPQTLQECGQNVGAARERVSNVSEAMQVGSRSWSFENFRDAIWIRFSTEENYPNIRLFSSATQAEATGDGLLGGIISDFIVHI